MSEELADNVAVPLKISKTFHDGPGLCFCPEFGV